MVVAMAEGLTVVFVSLLDDLAFVFPGAPDDHLSLSTGVGVLGHPVRRKVLTLLTENESQTRTELAEKLVADEDVSYQRRKHLEIALHHTHLPKLADHQYLAYDTRNGDVVLWEDPETVQTLLDSE